MNDIEALTGVIVGMLERQEVHYLELRDKMDKVLKRLEWIQQHLNKGSL